MRRWPAGKAQRGLTYLAGEMRRRHTRDLMWWQLRVPGLPEHARRGLIVVGALLFAGLCLGLAEVFVRVMSPDRPESPGGISLRTLVGSAGTMGLFAAATVRMFAVMHHDRPQRPAGPRRQTAIIAGTGAWLAVHTAFVHVDASLSALADLVVIMGAGLALTRSGGGGSSAGPGELLRGERRVTLIGAVVIAPAVGLFAVAVPLRAMGWDVALGGGLVAWFTTAAAFAVAGRWGQWVATRWALGALGLLPWRTMAFLRDTHRLGVLREAAGVYQFRHALLQQRLGPRREPAGDAPVELHVSKRVRSPLDRTWTSVGNWVFTAVLVGTTLSAPDFADDRLGLAMTALLIAVVFRRARGPRITLRADARTLEVATARGGMRCRWRDVAAIAVRETELHHAIMIKLRAKAKVPEGAVRDEAGWIVIWFLEGTPEVPGEISDALAAFAGDRWTGLP